MLRRLPLIMKSARGHRVPARATCMGKQFMNNICGFVSAEVCG